MSRMLRLLHRGLSVCDHTGLRKGQSHIVMLLLSNTRQHRLCLLLNVHGHLWMVLLCHVRWVLTTV